MNLALNIIFYIFTGIAGLSLLYYMPRLLAWWGSVRPQKRLVAEKNNRIALIVPARNESKAIGDFLASVTRQTYGHFDLHVVVANENDSTVGMVNAVGGKTWIAAGQTCKGDALDFCLQGIKASGESYDAYLIIDADCTMSDDYVERMNESLASGCQVLQSRREVKNYLIGKPALSWAGCCNGLIWTIIDGLGNRYKSDHRITCMTIGTGVMLRADVVEILGGWPYRQTLTEDMELMNDCVGRNFSTFYYEHAVLFLEESTSLDVTNKRRFRWLTGLIDAKRIYAKRVRHAARKEHKRRDAYFVHGLWPAFWYIGALTVAAVTFFVAAAVLALCGSVLWLKSLLLGGIALGLVYVSFLVLTAFCMIIARKHILLPFWKKVILFFVHPIFYMGYIRIVACALFLKHRRGWEVIDRIDCSLASAQEGRESK